MSKHIKQVIVIRKDLNMRRGKEISQGSHASMAFLTEHLQKSHYDKLSVVAKLWTESVLKTKITLQVNSETELLQLFFAAQNAGLEVHLITDMGLTEFGGVHTKTCLAIGPNYSEDIDKITSHLKLY